jgi:hypothetical protein
MGRTFDDLVSPAKPPSRTCKRCRAATTPGGNPGIVQVNLLARPYKSGKGFGGVLASRSTTLCEACAVDAYEAALLAWTDTMESPS